MGIIGANLYNGLNGVPSSCVRSFVNRTQRFCDAQAAGGASKILYIEAQNAASNITGRR
jgi:hypothetical protein